MVTIKSIFVATAVLALHWLAYRDPMLALIAVVVGLPTFLMMALQAHDDPSDEEVADFLHGRTTRRSLAAGQDFFDHSLVDFHADDRYDGTMRHNPMNAYYSSLTEWGGNPE
ncbi:hypothetical protein [Rugamonas aquatica]|uniref:Uncharacterized protein n=1 Tax=Rugamonas aquatica TaxID=2743357 RepID=A0A6A7N6P4_9BURK|nr:hypothetical protein [Rugamonas aquatica]MQA40578.1 hypothetical protein [Rugamonas aquatica]